MPRYPSFAKMPQRPQTQEETTPWARTAQVSLQRFHAVLSREVFVGNYTGNGLGGQNISHSMEGTPDVIAIVGRGSAGSQLRIGLWVGNDAPNIRGVGNSTFGVVGNGAAAIDQLNVNTVVYDYVMW